MIRARSLTKAYRGQRVLDQVSLEVGVGECLALLGPNGAGKTTLLRILATLTRPSAGTLVLGGVDALKDPEGARSLIALLAHGSHVYEDLTAIENLQFWASMRGQDASEARLRAALREVDLETVAQERARQFSAGMKRRIGLARVLLTEPRLLLLDEPFTGLDRRGRKWLTDLLVRLRDRGCTVVMATHSFGLDLGIADRMAILAGGRLVLDQPARTLPWEEIRRIYDSLTEGDGAAGNGIMTSGGAGVGAAR
jgi:heme exporter protein A